MAIFSSAGATSFLLRNNPDKAALTNPIVFPDVNPTAHYSWSIWTYAISPGIPHTLVGHVGMDGSLIHLGHDGVNWILFTRNAGIVNSFETLGPIAFNVWTLFCFTQNGSELKVYKGETDFSAPTAPIQPALITTISPDLNFQTDYFQFFCSSNNVICNFKFWNVTLTQVQLFNQANSFSTTGTPTPFWVSPLRIPGDISNVQYPFAGLPYQWISGHSYDEIANFASLLFTADPIQLIDTQCQAWILPTIPGVSPADTLTDSFVDPGNTPIVPTMYKAPQFFKFLDRGVVPLDQTIVSVLYYGYPNSGIDAGVAASEWWALYKDESGAEVSDVLNPNYRFSTPPDTSKTFAQIPSPFQGNKMYLWSFGAQFLYNPATPQQPSKSAHLSYIFLYVTYVGTLEGVIPVPAANLTGLFAVNKSGPSLDKYNGGTELKIPNPTIRTAYIGE